MRSMMGIDRVFSGVPGVDAGDKKSPSPGLNRVSPYFSGMTHRGGGESLKAYHDPARLTEEPTIRMIFRKRVFVCLLISLFSASFTQSQQPAAQTQEEKPAKKSSTVKQPKQTTSKPAAQPATPAAPGQVDEKLFGAMRWRQVGPFRGGRVLAVTGVPGEPNLFYFGAAAGGVWKTTDAGTNWQPIFDKQPVASIGAIAVAPSDHNIIYVGSGEACIRGNIS
jgi:hypothetical protein